MRITLPIGKMGLPLDIAEEKIPDILEKVIPSAMKHMGTLKDMGIDVNPMIRRFFGASEPTVTTVASEIPAKASVVEPTEDDMKKAGYWKSEQDNKWYPAFLQPKETISRNCATCKLGNSSTGTPITPYVQPCSLCNYDTSKPNWLSK